MAPWLTKLTAEQEALIPVVREEWISVGLQAAPADRRAAEAGVADAYRAAGLGPPRIFIWLDSPLAGAIGTTFLHRLFTRMSGDHVRGRVCGQVRHQVQDQVRREIWGQARGQVQGQVRDRVLQVWGQVQDQVGRQVENQARERFLDDVRDKVWGQVRGQVRGPSQVRDRFMGQVWHQAWGRVFRGQVRAHVGQGLLGQPDAGFLAWCDYWIRVGVKGSERAQGLINVARNAGWWWPLPGAVVLTERPRCVHLDDSGRLHAESGPAIVYPDGFDVYAWHGMHASRELIEEPIRLEQIKLESNAELRRMMIERYGLERYLRDTGAELVHEDECGKLWRAPLPGDEDLVMVEVLNWTPEPNGEFHTYFLRVLPTTRRAREGVAWTFDIPEAEYLPIVQS